MSKRISEATKEKVDGDNPDSLGPLGEQFCNTIPRIIADSIGDPRRWLATTFRGWPIEAVKHFIEYNKKRLMQNMT